MTSQPDTLCPECRGESFPTDPPCFFCHGVGYVIAGEQPYRILHPLFDGLCDECAGAGCDRCRMRGRNFRQIGHDIERLRLIGKRLKKKPFGLAESVDGKRDAQLPAGKEENAG